VEKATEQEHALPRPPVRRHPFSTGKQKAAKKQGIKKQSIKHWQRVLRPRTPGLSRRKINPYKAQRPLGGAGLQPVRQPNHNDLQAPSRGLPNPT